MCLHIIFLFHQIIAILSLCFTFPSLLKNLQQHIKVRAKVSSSTVRRSHSVDTILEQKSDQDFRCMYIFKSLQVDIFNSIIRDQKSSEGNPATWVQGHSNLGPLTSCRTWKLTWWIIRKRISWSKSDFDKAFKCRWMSKMWWTGRQRAGSTSATSRFED